MLPRFYGQIPRTADNDLYFGRLDYNLSDKNTFSASFNFLRWKSPNGIQTSISSTTGAAITGNGDDSVTVRNGKLTWTCVPKSNLVSEFRYGLDTDRQADTFDQSELGGGLGYLDVSVAGVQLGPGDLSAARRATRNTQRVLRRHQLDHRQACGEVRRNYLEYVGQVNYLSNRFGSYTYRRPRIRSRITAATPRGGKNWTTYTQTFGNPLVNFWIREIGVYLQDQWQSDRAGFR